MIPGVIFGQERADVGSQYSMKLGLSDSAYHGIAVCAACTSGNVSALKLHGKLWLPWLGFLHGHHGLLNPDMYN